MSAISCRSTVCVPRGAVVRIARHVVMAVTQLRREIEYIADGETTHELARHELASALRLVRAADVDAAAGEYDSPSGDVPRSMLRSALALTEYRLEVAERAMSRCEHGSACDSLDVIERSMATLADHYDTLPRT